MRQKVKSAAMPVAELKRLIPDVAVVARDLYQFVFRKDTAHCPFPENHNHGDRHPSLRHDQKKNRVFCASQNCFGEKGADAIGLVQRMERCSFPEAVQKLVDHYGIQTGCVGQNPSMPPAETQSKAPEGSGDDEQPVLAEKVRARLARRGFQAVAEFAYGANLRKVRCEHRTARQVEKNRPAKEFR